MCTSNKNPAPKPATGKGQNTALAILLAAEKLLIDEGYHNFSLRKVAATAELTLGKGNRQVVKDDRWYCGHVLQPARCEVN